MSMTKAQEIYENMLKNPENRKSSQGQVRQPSPFDDAEISSGNIDTSKIKEQVQDRSPVSADDQNYLKEIDARMAARKSGQMPALTEGAPGQARARAPADEIRINKLENRISEMEELLIVVMKTHMKLLNK